MSETMKSEARRVAMLGNSRAQKYDKPANVPLSLRCNEEDKERWQAAAKSESMSLNQWVIENLNKIKAKASLRKVDMKQIYKVTATQDRKIKTVGGFETAEEGYVVHLSFQEADSEQDAIDSVLAYRMIPGTKYDNIRAELI